MSTQKAIRCTLALVFLASGVAHADPVENLTTFTAGTPAVAAEVNGNFTEVADSVNDNDARIAELEAELSALQAQLSNLVALNDYLSLQTVHGKPTVRVTAANLQVVNGLGVTESADGTGNVLIGYDEERTVIVHQCSLGTDPSTGDPVTNETECTAAGGIWVINHKSGSHYLIVGPLHNYSRWGGIVVGRRNTSNYDFASVSGGVSNIASGRGSSVSGGSSNVASGGISSVSGGLLNTASGPHSSVSGGSGNTASGVRSSVTGGTGNIASADLSSVSGGDDNEASGIYSAVSGGRRREAVGGHDWVAGSLSEDE